LAAGEFPAPLFQLYDQNSKMYRLARVIGRHQLLVVFFDARFGADRSSQLQQLRGEFERFKSAGIQVVAISPATPFANRGAIKRAGEFPFPLLSDPDFQVHQAWGAFDAEARAATPAVFLVDRAGTIRRSYLGAAATIDGEKLMRELRQIP
jgi:peroxiredoxin